MEDFGGGGGIIQAKSAHLDDQIHGRICDVNGLGRFKEKASIQINWEVNPKICKDDSLHRCGDAAPIGRRPGAAKGLCAELSHQQRPTRRPKQMVENFPSSLGIPTFL